MSRPTLDVPSGYLGLALRTPTLPPAAHTNCYVVGQLDALVVDPGSPFAAEQELLARRLYEHLGRGGSLRGVFLTHHHGDHVGGAAAVARAFDLPLMAHGETFARLEVDAGLASLPRELLDDGDLLEVDDGARCFEVLHTPGHALGHLCLLETARGCLLGGDMVPGLGTTLIDPEEGSMAAYLEQLRRLAARDPMRVLPAHGPALVPGGAALETLIAHREAREEKVLAALGERPKSLAATARQAYAELPLQFMGLAQRSTLAHLEKLREEGRVEGIGDDGWRLHVGDRGTSQTLEKAFR